MKFFLSLSSLLVLPVLLVCGCASRGGGGATTDESMKQRLKNQAKSVAALNSENDKLRKELKDLEARNEFLVKENDQLREQVESKQKERTSDSIDRGGATAPGKPGKQR